MWQVALGAGVLVVGIVAAAEFANYRVSRLPPPVERARRGAVIVLGYRSTRRGKVHPMQRWRTRIGVRTASTMDDAWLIFTGAATRGAAASEASVMAAYAISRLGFAPERIQLEERARSTWDNVKYSVPMATAGSATQIAIASDPFYADKARRYVALQFPDVAVVRAHDYRLLERWWLKLITTAYYLRLRASGTYGAPPPDFTAPERGTTSHRS